MLLLIQVIYSFKLDTLIYITLGAYLILSEFFMDSVNFCDDNGVGWHISRFLFRYHRGDSLEDLALSKWLIQSSSDEVARRCMDGWMDGYS